MRGVILFDDSSHLLRKYRMPNKRIRNTDVLSRTSKYHMVSFLYRYSRREGNS